MQLGPGDQKILPELHEMTSHRKQMLSALPSDSEGESKEELEYPWRGAKYEDWEGFHKHQIRFMQYDLYEKVQAFQQSQDNYKKLEEKLKKANNNKTLVARNATRQALQLVWQLVPFDEREYTRVTHYACKDLFWTFKFFATEEEVWTSQQKDHQERWLWPTLTLYQKNRCSGGTSIGWRLKKESPIAGMWCRH